jgi:hypothetical protein
MFPISARFMEASNGIQFVVQLALLLFFAKYIVRVYRERRPVGRFYWYAGPPIAVLVFVFGGALMRGPLWLLRHMANTGRSTDALDAPMMLLIAVGTIISTAGGLYIIWEFSPERCGVWPLIVIAVLAFAFGIGMAV